MEMRENKYIYHISLGFVKFKLSTLQKLGKLQPVCCSKLYISTKTLPI